MRKKTHISHILYTSTNIKTSQLLIQIFFYNEVYIDINHITFFIFSFILFDIIFIRSLSLSYSFSFLGLVSMRLFAFPLSIFLPRTKLHISDCMITRELLLCTNSFLTRLTDSGANFTQVNLLNQSWLCFLTRYTEAWDKSRNDNANNMECN